ncbi:hypothetical protein BCEP27_40114 [Burkholderia cepacia]
MAATQFQPIPAVHRLAPVATEPGIARLGFVHINQ